jgi:hypothetical protein
MGGEFGLDSSKKDCMLCLRVYYGLEPYKDHTSRGSGVFYQYIKMKYSGKLINECEKELECQK